ncbi:transglutaminase-like domain-containing protein [Methylovorus glucosotrophus]|uniref:Transglutaminase-like domain-containing protein n=1 Tax=Methylovorus glucosotrophus (strain SIP3-4) TaxID=582744 RepID=C6X7U5_METGS|nr:transglutaminase-like domain-containing protein [Methylovorus glucosotrophus]ACT51272.1 hypothetical protein Msip34_2030 [Methylovorus glucosotrophus SIP3-4]
MTNKIITLLLLIPILIITNAVEVKDMNIKYFDIKNKSSIHDFRQDKFEEAINNHDIKKPDNWNLLVDKVKEQPNEYEQLATANLLINQIPYIDNTNGSYMSPNIALNRGGIVCKDYAIIKYILLKDAGFNINNMLFMVHDSLTEPDTGQAHVVLAVKINNEIFIANQYMKSTAIKYYKEYGINKDKFSKSIKKEGVNALTLNFNTDSYYTKKSLYPLKKYNFNERKLFSLLNENGNYKLAVYNYKKRK